MIGRKGRRWKQVLQMPARFRSVTARHGLRPGIPLRAMKWLFMKHAPLILHPKIDTAMLSWMARMLTNCTADRYALNKSRMLQLTDPNVTIVYDVKPEDAASVREETFGDLAKRRELVAAPHLPFPGVGYVRAEGAGSFSWHPLEYRNRANR